MSLDGPPGITCNTISFSALRSCHKNPTSSHIHGVSKLTWDLRGDTCIAQSGDLCVLVGSVVLLVNIPVVCRAAA